MAILAKNRGLRIQSPLMGTLPSPRICGFGSLWLTLLAAGLPQHSYGVLRHGYGVRSAERVQPPRWARARHGVLAGFRLHR